MLIAKLIRRTLLLLAAGLAVPTVAGAQDAVLYEVTENMKVTKKLTHRLATSALLGSANVGSALCPQELVDAVSPGATQCTVNAVGTDNLDLATGIGPVSGKFTVVIQEPLPGGSGITIDSPEVVVMRGNFRGTIDLSPALGGIAPFGTLTGTMTAEKGHGKFPFLGVFRLPTPCEAFGGPAGLACYLEGVPVALPSVDLVGPNEHAIGFPTVKLEIYFQ